ncbi:MAG TPA: tetraacyldisaccharide 4'-kinase [Casimicrobiaceae bacterium]|nr:tetraacyldisaccharide 4'-kinase [Casimicrobiaceae bacterium]
MGIRERLVTQWYAPRIAPLSALLAPLSWLFGGIVCGRRALFRSRVLKSERIGVPVVVVGNIVAGGSGKTPLAIALAHALAAQGRRPGFISRGHGGSESGPLRVDAQDDASRVGDEPLLLAASGFPTFIGHNRVAAARALLAALPSCDVVIADDGLQHYRLARDVEIAVIDETRGIGNGLMLPAGPLREPSSRLATVDAIVRLTQRKDAVASSDGRTTTMAHVPLRLRQLVDPSRRVDATMLSGQSVHAVAAIGNPERFFALLASMGIIATPHAFPDHHAFTTNDLEFAGAQAIVMTAKDAVKCARFRDPRHYALDIVALIDPALVNLVLERIDGRQAS